MKEFFRKFMVGLKRKPSIIPLLVLVVAFLVYALNLTHISDTTAKIQGPNMGLTGFATMLFSTLSLVCFMNAFPKRKPVNKPMLILMFAMNALLLFCDFYYNSCIVNAVTRADNPIAITTSTAYIYQASWLMGVHQTILIVGLVLTILLPVYSKLLNKVKTSIEVEENADMGAIDLSGED